jgi:hypothetical protein
MHEITAEGVRFIYVPQREINHIFQEIEQSPYIFRGEKPCPFMEEQLQYAGDIRMAFFPSYRKGRYWLYYLFWSHPIDLLKLDDDVIAGIVPEALFVETVRTHYQHTLCSTCHNTFHTLVIPGGDPYVDNLSLMDRKIAQSCILSCPICHNSLRQLVVKIF